MGINRLIIKDKTDWAALTKSLKALSRNLANDVRYIAGVDQLSSDICVIDIVVMQVHGKADYALEVHGKSMIDLPDDTVGMHVAVTTGEPVIVPANTAAPNRWLLLSPDGKLEDIDLNVRKLNEQSIVDYEKAEQKD